MYIADLHIHSKYSRATSRDLTPQRLDFWASRKGIGLLGTGDFTHPAWRRELEEALEPAEEGLYRLKEELAEGEGAAGGGRPRFVISGEISSIYKKDGRVRKVHSVILLPSLEDAERLAKKLETIGNIHSDGRPILGLDCRDLLEITLEICPQAIYIPAHIWTPHFSLFGAFSGFDRVEECFGDMTPYIHAMETGLSSDPPMNWRLSALDRYNLVSNSDAHSPSKLGREANLIEGELSYSGLYGAIQEGRGLKGTIEFFPEEGKYHYDGHRKCHVCLSPKEAERHQGICPVCGKKLTIGVSHRVEQLADRQEGAVSCTARPFESLAPLPEVIAAAAGKSASSRKVQEIYENLVSRLGPEFEILRTIPTEEIRRASSRLIAEGVNRLREGKVERLPGFDGEYGAIKLFEPWELEDVEGQISLFAGADGGLWGLSPKEEGTKAERQAAAAGWEQPGAEPKDGKAAAADGGLGTQKTPASLGGLNPLQRQAAEAAGRTVAVVAGPGTGKTKTLVARIQYLLTVRKVKAGEITAVTFTNKAAEEMKKRLKEALGGRTVLGRMRIGTFHSICYDLLRKLGREFQMAQEAETLELAAQAAKETGLSIRPVRLLGLISRKKTDPDKDWKTLAPDQDEERLAQAFSAYERGRKDMNALDFDDLLGECLAAGERGELDCRGFAFLLVDEFQDMNPLQYRLLRCWNRQGRELFVIGDPDQSIYGFRGASPQFFDQLVKDDPQALVIRLKDNYRSAPPILCSARQVISCNSGPQRAFEPVRERREGEKVRLVTAPSELSEAIFTAKEISRMVGGLDMLEAQERFGSMVGKKARGFEDIAVLYRTHRQGDLLERCFRQEGIPYVVVGRDEFLTADTVRGSLCFFASLRFPEDGLALRTCLKLLWGLGENELSKSIYQSMAEKYAPLCVKGKPQKVLAAWMEEMGLGEDGPMNQLLSMGIFYKTMADFLDGIAFGGEGDLKRCGQKVYHSGAVTLMTLHGSKGLEFPAVFLYGARKGMLPLETGTGETDMEEERRLFFVGMTRAEDELIITASGEPSPFTGELPEDEILRETAGKRENPSGIRQMSLFDFMK